MNDVNLCIRSHREAWDSGQLKTVPYYKILCQTGGDFEITLQTIIALNKHAFSKIHSFYSMVRTKHFAGI